MTDYRNSHIGKGDDYDRFIDETPLDAYMAEWERRHLQRILSRLDPELRKRHLDFACGTGRIAAIVAPYCTESIGVDVSPSMLAIARQKCPSAAFVEADITDGSIDFGGTFNLVTAFRFFGNAQNGLRHSVLEKLSQIMQVEGVLILNSHRNPFAIKNVLHRLTGGTDELDLNYRSLKRLLSHHGFEVVSSYPIGFWLFRNSMAAHEGLTALSGEKYEWLFSQDWLSAFSPDSIVVARKTGKRQ